MSRCFLFSGVSCENSKFIYYLKNCWIWYRNCVKLGKACTAKPRHKQAAYSWTCLPLRWVALTAKTARSTMMPTYFSGAFCSAAHCPSDWPPYYSWLPLWAITGSLWPVNNVSVIIIYFSHLQRIWKWPLAETIYICRPDQVYIVAEAMMCVSLWTWSRASLTCCMCALCSIYANSFVQKYDRQCQFRQIFTFCSRQLCTSHSSNKIPGTTANYMRELC